MKLLMCNECGEEIQHDNVYLIYEGNVFCCKDCLDDWVEADTSYRVADLEE